MSVANPPRDGGGGGGGGASGQLVLTPSSAVNLGNIIVGNSASVVFIAQNTGVGPLSITNITAGLSIGHGYAWSGYPALPFTLAPGESTSFTLILTPMATGAYPVTVDVSWEDANGSEPDVTVAVTGTGITATQYVGAFVPASLSFPTTQVNTTDQLAIALENLGTSPFTVTSLGFATGTNFSLINPPTTPFTLAPVAAIALINKAVGDNGASAATTVASTAQNHTTGNLLVALIRSGTKTNTVTSVTDTAGNTYIQCPGVGSAAYTMVDIWYCLNAVGNANNIVTAHFSLNQAGAAIIVHQYSNVGSFEVGANGNFQGASNLVTSGSFAPSASGNVNVAIVSEAGAAVSWTAGVGYALESNSGTSDAQSEDLIGAPLGAQTATMTFGGAASTGLDIAVASFRSSVQNLVVQFNPITVGSLSDTLSAVTDNAGTITASVQGICLLIVSVAINANNTRRLVATGYDANGLQGQPAPLACQPDSLNSDQAGLIVFNGAIWEGMGVEKTLMRLGFYYENLGVANLTAIVTVFRPQLGADSTDVKTYPLALGTALADGTTRYAEIDSVATGEIITLSLSRAVASGPVSICAILPYFEPRGVKVANV